MPASRCMPASIVGECNYGYPNTWWSGAGTTLNTDEAVSQPT